MKTLDDGTMLPARIWYYLLDYIDKDKTEHIFKPYNTYALHKLTKDQMLELLDAAVKCDTNLILSNK